MSFVFVLVEMQFCTPCIRAMVIESSCMAKSSLFIITCTGGTIGREENLGHAIVIADPAVSKVSSTTPCLPVRKSVIRRSNILSLFQSDAGFQKRRINLELVILRSENIPRFIRGLSFGVLAMLSILRITILRITRQCL